MLEHTDASCDDETECRDGSSLPTSIRRYLRSKLLIPQKGPITPRHMLEELSIFFSLQAERALLDAYQTQQRDYKIQQQQYQQERITSEAQQREKQEAEQDFREKQNRARQTQAQKEQQAAAKQAEARHAQVEAEAEQAIRQYRTVVAQAVAISNLLKNQSTSGQDCPSL
ncbi:MAG: hypothetical protein AAFY41_00500 [Bacteroidota bacterium]